VPIFSAFFVSPSPFFKRFGETKRITLSVDHAKDGYFAIIFLTQQNEINL
jgi:hypothetical protein